MFTIIVFVVVVVILCAVHYQISSELITQIDDLCEMYREQSKENMDLFAALTKTEDKLFDVETVLTNANLNLNGLGYVIRQGGKIEKINEKKNTRAKNSSKTRKSVDAKPGSKTRPTARKPK